jgi:hypothetical protein
MSVSPENWCTDGFVIDGGGVRGLSSIMILRQIMKRVNEQRAPQTDQLEPWQVFDLIGGTSTGGYATLLFVDCLRSFFSVLWPPAHPSLVSSR